MFILLIFKYIQYNIRCKIICFCLWVIGILFLQMSSVSTGAVISLSGVLKNHLERTRILKCDESYYDNHLIHYI